MLVYILSHIFTPCTVSNIASMSTKSVRAQLSDKLSHVHNGLNRLSDKVSSSTNVVRNNIVASNSPIPISLIFSFVLAFICAYFICKRLYSEPLCIRKGTIFERYSTKYLFFCADIWEQIHEPPR